MFPWQVLLVVGLGLLLLCMVFLILAGSLEKNLYLGLFVLCFVGGLVCVCKAYPHLNPEAQVPRPTSSLRVKAPPQGLFSCCKCKGGVYSWYSCRQFLKP